MLIYVFSHGIVSLEGNARNVLDQNCVVILGNIPVLQQFIQLIQLHAPIRKKSNRKQSKYEGEDVIELQIMLILNSIFVGCREYAEVMIHALFFKTDCFFELRAVMAKTIGVDAIGI